MNALEKKEGPCVVLAGAGTGKTYTIVEKVKKLFQEGVYDIGSIVCITFSNEAANSLRARLQREIGATPVVETFHAFSADLIRENWEKVGIKEDFGILTPDEAKVILNKSLKVTPYYCHKYVSEIGMAKDLGVTLQDVKVYLGNKDREFKDVDKTLENLRFTLQTMHLGADKDNRKAIVEEIKRVEGVVALKKFVKIWDAYEKIKERHGYLDYSDLNKLALELLRKNEEVVDKFQYVIVDEFQDTNKTQLDFLEVLARHGNIMVVGDLNQSIYRFRGAYKENFNQFKESFKVKDGEIFELDKSYRSPNSVLTLAYQLIRENYENKADCFLVENAFDRPGGKMEVYEMENGYEEARKVIDLIRRERNNGVEMNEICVMFRTHQQGRVLRRVLESEGIEYSSVSRKSLLENGEVRSAMDYLVILDSLKRKKKGGEQAWWDLVYRAGFKEQDLIKIGRFFKEQREAECLSATVLNELGKVELSDDGKLRLKVLFERIKGVLDLEYEKVSDLITEVYRIGNLIGRSEDKKSKEALMNMNKFRELADGHASLFGQTLGSFVDYLETLRGLGIEVEASQVKGEGIQLMTVHATKGLEYKTVILTNMAAKRFPLEMYSRKNLIPLELFPEFKMLSGMSDAEKDVYVRNYEMEQNLLEERRLCYVAFTRAKERLILTHAKEYGGKKAYPSQFLSEINYRGNELVSFAEDKGTGFEMKEPEVQSALTFESAVRKDNFDSLIGEMAKPVNVEKKDMVFSPSALLLFNECQKRYEYKYVYQMPEEKTISWEAIQLGSFVHLVLEEGVNSNFKSEKEYLDNARELAMHEDWESVDLSEAEHMIRVFFERNRDKITDKSLTEQYLESEIEGFKFRGFADRIDFNDSGLEIVDYKTGKGQVAPKHRDWQLGYYAIAAEKLGKVKKLTLDMLRHEKPLEFEINSEGVAKSVNGRMEFSIPDIRAEIVETARAIVNARENGFKACGVDKNCDFCNEYVYGL